MKRLLPIILTGALGLAGVACSSDKTQGGSVSYASCAEVKEKGAAPLSKGQPGYSTKLDRDGDGVACDS